MKPPNLCLPKRTRFHGPVTRLPPLCKDRPNGKLIFNSFMNDDELTEKELKRVEADDQAIQTILLGLPEDIDLFYDRDGVIYDPSTCISKFQGKGCALSISFILIDLIAQKEESRIQLQAKEFDLMACCMRIQASTSGTQTDKASVYDSDGSAEVSDIDKRMKNGAKPDKIEHGNEKSVKN
ncbi:hypothetical protein Tco_0678212 [Tanacetum coccineum]|uniref:Uncharacterized protein n=1 Tax=Tanacetum coccineum TaxID=301880 RepID=A0ABQ4XFB1_9ASTR